MGSFIDKMAVRRTADKTIIGNILVNSFIRIGKRKICENQKPLLIEYLVFISFIMIIINQLVCLRLTDPHIRLYLFDMTLFIGGIEQYNSYVIIILSFMALAIFTTFHITTDKRLIMWVNIYEMIRGTAHFERHPLFIRNKEHLPEIRLFTEFANIVSIIVYLAFGKCSSSYFDLEKWKNVSNSINV